MDPQPHRYMLDVGQSSDWLALQVALAPCLLGYGAIAQHLHANQLSKREGNPYWTWIQNYVADDYVQAVKTGSGRQARAYMLNRSWSAILTQVFLGLVLFTRAPGTPRGAAVAYQNRRIGPDIQACCQGLCLLDLSAGTIERIYDTEQNPFIDGDRVLGHVSILVWGG